GAGERRHDRPPLAADPDRAAELPGAAELQAAVRELDHAVRLETAVSVVAVGAHLELAEPEAQLVEHVRAEVEQNAASRPLPDDRSVEFESRVGRRAPRADACRQGAGALDLGIDEPELRSRSELRQRWEVEVLGDGAAADHPQPHGSNRW